MSGKVSENVLLAYLNELAKDKKSSTFWSTDSTLKKTVDILEKVNFAQYVRLEEFLKKQNVG